MGPDALAQVLRPLKQHTTQPALLVGLDAIDDAAVYRTNEQQAIISTADFFPPVENDLQKAIQSMMQLNRRASEALVQAGKGVHAVTDITGFGLLGHAWEMATQSLASMRFHYEALPLLPNVQRYATSGCAPGGARRK